MLIDRILVILLHFLTVNNGYNNIDNWKVNAGGNSSSKFLFLRTFSPFFWKSIIVGHRKQENKVQKYQIIMLLKKVSPI